MFQALRKTLKALTLRQKWTYWTLVGLRALSGILDVAGMALIALLAGLTVNAGLENNSFDIFGIHISAVTPETMLALVLVILGVFLFKAILALALSVTLAYFVAGVETARTSDMAQVLLGGTLSQVKELSRGEIQYALSSSSFSAFTGMLTNVATIVSEGTLLLLIGVTLFVFDPIATTFVLIYFAIVITLIQLIIGKSLARAGREIASGGIDVTTSINDYLNSFREIFVFRKGEYFLERFNRGRRRVSRANASLVFLGTLPRYTVETFLMLGVVAFVGWQFLTGGLASGIVTIGLFVTGGVRIMGSLLPLQNGVAAIKTNAEQANLAHRILDDIHHLKSARTVPTPDVVDAGRIADSSALSVEVENVTFHYPDASTPALDQVSIGIAPGQHVAIVGPSGSGKTTMVDLILGLLEPSHGSVRISGERPLSLLSSNPGIISYVPQRPGLISGTLRDNIALGVQREDVDDARVEYAYTAAFLSDLVASLPEGLDSDVGTHADSLSGGQIQRLGLARALYEQPKLLILDEATSALDASSEAFVAKSIAALQREVTVITVAHRLSTIQHADQVFVLEDSQLIGQGTFAELRRSSPLIAEYVELMSFDELPETD